MEIKFNLTRHRLTLQPLKLGIKQGEPERPLLQLYFIFSATKVSPCFYPQDQAISGAATKVSGITYITWLRINLYQQIFFDAGLHRE